MQISIFRKDFLCKLLQDQISPRNLPDLADSLTEELLHLRQVPRLDGLHELSLEQPARPEHRAPVRPVSVADG